MKRQLPLILVFVFGTLMVIQYFVPHENSEMVKGFLLDWIIIIGIFALALGLWSLVHVSVGKINSRKENWEYPLVTLISLTMMIFFGFTAHAEDASWWGYFLAIVVLLAALWMLLQGLMGNAANRNAQSLISLGLLIVFSLLAFFDSSWEFKFYTAEGLTNQMFVHFFDYMLIPLHSTMFALLAFFITSASYRAFRARNLLATLLLISALIVMLRFTPGPWGEYLAKTSAWVMNVPNLAAQRAIVIGIGLGIVATALKVILGIERGYMGKG
jgi:hypothetical protein